MNVLRIVITLFSLAVMISCQKDIRKPLRGTLETVKTASGRTYELFEPAGRNGPVPLIIVLHGSGSNAYSFRHNTGFDIAADEFGWAAVFADATRPFPGRQADMRTNPQVWNDGSGRAHAAKNNAEDVLFIESVIDELTARGIARRNKVYLAGFSNGGSMALRLITEKPGLFQKAAVSTGVLWNRPSETDQEVPLLYILGEQDSVFPEQGGSIRLPYGKTDSHPPVTDTLNYFARIYECSGQVLTTEGPVSQFAYRCKSRNLLTYIKLKNTNHVWPGSDQDQSKDLDATGAIMRFFANDSLPLDIQ